MRLPDIPERHRRLTRTIAAVGTGALALVRRRDFALEHEPAVRLGNALASAGVTWITGTQAFLGRAGDEFDLGAVFGPFGKNAGEPVRYSTADQFADEDATARSQAFLNATAAATSGVISWSLWDSTQKIAEAIDARLPAGMGRGLGAAASGSLVALGAVVLDKLESWACEDCEELNYGQVEIDLPDHIRACIVRLLSQPHPMSGEAAEAARAQFDSARFFVGVTYPSALHSGTETVTVDSGQLAQLFDDEDITSIDVYPSASSPKAVPATQTYPVIGVRTIESRPTMELRLEFVDGYLSRLEFSEPDTGSVPLLSDDLPADSGIGTLHPDGVDVGAEGVGYWSSLDITEAEDELVLLSGWPEAADLTFRTDRE